jgi:flagellar motor switch protein FliN/FliY
MPATAVDVERLQALMGEAAEAAVASLPLQRALLAGFAGEGTQPEEFLPGDGALAVAAELQGGVHGRLVLLVAAELGEAVAAAADAPGGVAAALQAALVRAAAVLEQSAGEPVAVAAAAEVDPAAAIAGAAAAVAFLGAPLFEGEEHQASLVLLVDDRPAAPAPGEAAADVARLGVASYPQVAPAPVAAVPGSHPLHLLRDVEMDVTVELGRARMAVRHVLSLMPGSVVELDRAAGAPVDLLVNGTLIARGEVVVIDEEFGVRISEIVGRDEGGA